MHSHTTNQSVEYITLGLPTNALEHVAGQIGGQSRSRDLLTGAASGRSGSFPCIKKSSWDDRILLRVIRKQHRKLEKGGSYAQTRRHQTRGTGLRKEAERKEREANNKEAAKEKQQAEAKKREVLGQPGLFSKI